MARTYSYDPTKCDDGDFNQMRFELGDTMIDEDGQPCALCDEEYTAMINKAAKANQGWNFAKLYCLKAILMQYAHETNYSADGMSVSLGDRYDRFQKMYKELKGGVSLPIVTNAEGTAGGASSGGGGHSFRVGMLDYPQSLTRGER